MLSALNYSLLVPVNVGSVHDLRTARIIIIISVIIIISLCKFHNKFVIIDDVQFLALITLKQNKFFFTG